MRCLVATCVIGGVLAASGCRSESDRNATPAHSCDSCALQLQLVAELGAAEDPAGPDRVRTAAAVDEAGNWYVVPGVPGTEILVYGPSGTVSRTIGRRGDGPGEITGAVYLTVSHDTLRVFSNGRLSAFSTSGEPLESRVFAGPGGRPYFAPNGEVLLQRSDMPPVRIVDAQNEVTLLGPADSSSPLGSMAVSFFSEDSIWMARPDHYMVELWNRSNVRVRTIERHPPWFQWPQEGVKAILHDIWVERSSRRLWVSLFHLLQASEANPTAVTVVEVLDMDTGGLIATDSIVGGYALTFTDQGDLYWVEEAPEGHHVMKLFRPRLTGVR